jgi:hypothetical protein
MKATSSKDLEELVSCYGGAYLADVYDELMQVWVSYNAEQEQEGSGVYKNMREYYHILRATRDIFRNADQN